MRIADSLYEERGKHRLVLLNNQTGIPFVTGDQPIINLHATFGKVPPESLEFYYPISPTRAMSSCDRRYECSSNGQWG